MYLEYRVLLTLSFSRKIIFLKISAREPKSALAGPGENPVQLMIFVEILDVLLLSLSGRNFSSTESILDSSPVFRTCSSRTVDSRGVFKSGFYVVSSGKLSPVV